MVPVGSTRRGVVDVPISTVPFDNSTGHGAVINPARPWLDVTVLSPPLPLEPFRYYQYGERIVHLDGCVEVEAAYYGAPPGWIGRVLRVQWDELYDIWKG